MTLPLEDKTLYNKVDSSGPSFEGRVLAAPTQETGDLCLVGSKRRPLIWYTLLLGLLFASLELWGHHFVVCPVILLIT